MKHIIVLVIISVIGGGINIISAQEQLIVESGSKVTIQSTMRIGNEKGKIVDTSYELIAKAANIYKPDIMYGPYEITVDTGSIIQGIYQGILGMKKGEKKNLLISGTGGFQEKKSTKIIPYTSIAPIFSYRANIDVLTSDLILTIPRTDIPDFIKVQLEGVAIGTTIIGDDKSVSTLISMDENRIILRINNTSPFFRKNIVPGLICIDNGFEMKVIGIEGDEVTIEVTNTESPFYKKDFIVGSTVISKFIKWKILAIKKDSVTVSTQDLLFGRTLLFDIEILDIK